MLWTPNKKLVFPAGRAPGFDPTHIAAVGIAPGWGLSTAALGNGNHINLLTGQPGTVDTTAAPNVTDLPTAAMLGGIGPCSYFNGVHVGCRFLNQNPAGGTGVFTGVTMAGIFQVAAVGGLDDQVLVSNCGATNSVTPGGLEIDIVNTTGELNMAAPDIAYNPVSGLFVSANVPYFVIASYIYNPQSIVNYLLMRLDTGVIQTATTGVSSAGGGSINYNTNSVGNLDSHNFNGYIAATMISNIHFMEIHEMLAWAQDPWSFWYPPRYVPQVGLLAQLMSVATGFYNLTGEANTEHWAHKLPSATGYYSLTGEAAALTEQHKLSVATGYYTLSGEAVTLKWAHKLPAATGYYTLSGEAVTLTQAGGSVTMAVLTGYYVLTGEASTTLWAHKLTLATGYYSVTGEAITINLKMSVATGYYNMTGEADTMLWKHLLSVATGYYSLTGEAATLAVGGAGNISMSVLTGFYTLTGEAATTLWAHKLLLATGYYSVTGEASTFGVGMPAATGFYALTGETDTMLWKHLLSTATGYYSLTGQSSIFGVKMSVATGYYSASGEAISLRWAHRLAAVAGYYTLSGETATMTFSGALNVSAQPSLSGYDFNALLLGNELNVINPLTGRIG